MRRRSSVVAVLALFAMTACGSTVQQTSGPGALSPGAAQLGGGSAELGTGTGGSGSVDPLTGAATEVAPGAASGSAATGPTGGSAGQPAVRSGGSGSRAGTSTQPGPAAGTTPAAVAEGRRGPGVADKTVRLGFQYVDVGPGTGAVIGKDVSVGDPEAQAAAVRDWINKHGGMGGRKLEIVNYGAPYANLVNNPQAEYNKICTFFTEDNKVLGVATYVPDEALVRCLAKRDVMSVGDGYPLDRKLYSELAQHFYSPGTMSQDRGAEVGVAGLHAAGFFKGAKIGLLRYDDPLYARAEMSLQKALNARGLTIADRFLIDSSNAGKAFSDAGAAVLRFRQLEITHITVLDNSGGIAFAFMQAAENQGYRPFYALTTNNSPQALKQLAPNEQLLKAKAVSWWWGDVGTDEKQQEPPARPASRAQCLKIMTDAGVDLKGAAAGSAIVTCDQLFFFKTLMDRTAAPNSAAMSAAADGLGTSYSSPLTYRTTLKAGRRDGATVTRLLRFDAASREWVYAGPGPSAP